jgi:hypothetical protein
MSVESWSDLDKEPEAAGSGSALPLRRSARISAIATEPIIISDGEEGQSNTLTTDTAMSPHPLPAVAEPELDNSASLPIVVDDDDEWPDFIFNGPPTPPQIDPPTAGPSNTGEVNSTTSFVAMPGFTDPWAQWRK